MGTRRGDDGRTRPAGDPTLPTFATRLIGRDADLSALRRCPRGLVSLVGLAGVGKTRVAVEHARRLSAEPLAAFVDLTPIEDRSAALRSVAAALELSLGSDEAQWGERIAAALERREPSWLVLDNLEHLLPELRDAVALWAARTSGWILVTSRRRVGLEAETVVELGALDSLPGRDAEALFLHVARCVRPTYAPAGDELDAVREVVRRLEGLPLAIELAAGAMSALDAVTLADELAGSLGVLNGGSGRHATLERCIAWSFDRLDPCARETLRSTRVFRGGFTFDALVAVRPELGRGQALSALRGLRASFLVQAEERGTRGRLRLRLPVAVRAFLEERAEPEDEVLVARHAAHYRRLAEDLARLAWGPSHREAIEAFATEEANLLAVIERAPIGSALATAVAMEAAFESAWPVVQTSGLLRRLLERAAVESLEPEDRAPRAVLFALLARAFADLGDPLGAERALDEARVEVPSEARAHVLRAAAFVANRAADYEGSARIAAQAAEHARRVGDGPCEALARLGRANTLRALGRFEEADRELDEAEALLRHLRKDAKLFVLVGLRAALRAERGEHRDAVVGFEEAVRLAETTGARRDRLMAESCLAYARILAGAHADALRQIDRTVRIAREAGMLHDVAYLLGNRALAHHDAGAFDEAEEAYEVARVHRAGAREAYAAFDGYLGLLLLARGDDASAVTHLRAAAETLRATGEHELADVFEAGAAAAGDDDESRAWLARAPASGPGRWASSIARLRSGEASLAEVRDALRDEDERRIPQRLLLQAAVQRAGAPIDVHRIAEDGSGFRAPEGEWVDLSRRTSLRRILARLARAHVDAPSSAVGLDELFEVGWPAQKATPESAAHRVYVALSTLRRLGLRGALQRWESGYRFDPGLAIEVRS